MSGGHSVRTAGCRVGWTCGDCGKKYGKHVGGVHTWHEGTCDVCGERAGITSIRHFDHIPGYECRCDLKGGTR